MGCNWDSSSLDLNIEEIVGKVADDTYYQQTD